MEISARSYLTAGVAAIGAGAIALTPVQPVPNHLALAPQRAVESLAVDLAASIDPITPWVNTFQTAAANFQNLVNFYLQQPLPLINTIGANIKTYISELPDIQLVASQILGNVQTFFKAPWSPGDPAGEYVSPVQVANVPIIGAISQQTVFALLPAVLGQETYAKLEPIINWTATPYSAEITGLLGTLLAPVIQLTRSFSTIGADFQAGDVEAAINELINIPANVTNAVLNGAGYLDLTGVVNAIQPLPPEVTSIGLNLGGVLNAVPASGTIEAPESWSGGTAFDGLATQVSYKISNLPPPNGTSVNVDDPGIPVGWWGSVIGLGQFLGDQLLVTPPAQAQAKLAASTAAAPKAVEAAAAETPAAVADVPAVAAESPAKPVAPRPAKAAAAKVAAAAKKAAAALAPKLGKSAAGSANSGNDKAVRASSRGKAASSAARHAG